MNSTPLVSIIIPVFNGAAYLREAIDSALAQTYSNIEVIVVNDGSSDDGKTEEIIKFYGEKIRYFKKENGGVASALNLGIREMKGDYFSWLSHDDVYFPDKIKTQILFLQKLGKDVVLYGDIEYIDEHSKKIGEYHVREVAPGNFLWELLRRPFLVHGCTVLCPKVFLNAVGGFNEKLRTTQDYELWFRLANVFQWYHVPQVLVFSRLHSQQGMNTMKPIFKKEKKALSHWIWQYFSLEAFQKSSGKKWPFWRMKLSCAWNNFVWDQMGIFSNFVPQRIKKLGMRIFLKK